MKVAEVMTRSCHIIDASNSLQKAAEIMSAENIGALPVAENDRLIGVITDRDIVTRGLAKGKTGRARVRDAMTQSVKYCYEDEDLDHTLQNMADIQLRRLPVMNRQKRLVGIVSLADAARFYSPDAVGATYCGVVGVGDRISHTSLD